MAQIKEKKKGYLVLASGRVFTGWIFGADPETTAHAPTGEVVFNTSLTGYQEILTDPSYQGQIVVMTPSHVGNYGVNAEDTESRRIFLSGFVVQEESAMYSNWRASESLHDYLAKAGVVGLTGVDTRALTRHLRTQGAINGIISSDGKNLDALIKKAKKIPSLEGQDLTKIVTTEKKYHWDEKSLELPSDIKKESHAASRKKKVVVIDFGVKKNILRCLADMNCDVTVVPSSATAKDVLDLNPDGILLSNGPGDPAAVEDGVRTIRDLINQDLERRKKNQKTYAMFGICLGHQMMGLALGGSTYKLKFGHHGANHPIKDLESGRVDITTQNHGFCVEGEQTKSGEWIVKGNKDAIVTHINLNDNAVEGLRHKTLPVFSVQYHPEASSGPHDAQHLFERFMTLMEN